MKTLAIAVMAVAVMGCSAIKTVQGWTANPPMALDAPADAVREPDGGLYVDNDIEPKVVSQISYKGKYRVTVWQGMAPFTSVVFCKDGLPTEGSKKCLRAYYGIKIDGSESMALQSAGAIKRWRHVWTPSEQLAAGEENIDAKCSVYHMAGC